VDQGRPDGRIDPAPIARAALPPSHFAAHFLDGLAAIIGHVPVAAAAADLVHEAAEIAPPWRVSSPPMELHSVELRASSAIAAIGVASLLAIT